METNMQKGKLLDTKKLWELDTALKFPVILHYFYNNKQLKA